LTDAAPGENGLLLKSMARRPGAGRPKKPARECRTFVLGNAHVHAARRGHFIRPDAIDPLSSAANRHIVAEPHTWLLRFGWVLGLPSG
jgi:hypothetical protein